jgi:SlyX protein
MGEVGDLKTRIEALEAAVAHQDRTIDELSAVITEQWKVIEGLKRQLSRLEGQLDEVAAGLPAPPIQKPPHY